MKIIIAGSRRFTDYGLLKEKCDFFLQNQSNVEIVSGTAAGADTLGERYAVERGYKVKRFPADWSKGIQAGHIRNAEMAAYADAAIIFFVDGSKGSQSMLKAANRKGIAVRVVDMDALPLLVPDDEPF